MSLYSDKKPKSKTDILVAQDDDTNIYFSENAKVGKEFLPLTNGKLIPIVQKNQICSAFISGAMGSGKSTFAMNMIKSLLNRNKSIKLVYFVTGNTIPDPAFDGIRSMTIKTGAKIRKRDPETKKLYLADETMSRFQQLDITNPKLYETELNIFSNSVILFDDYEILDKPIEKALTDFQKKCITYGRKANIHPIIIRHKIQNNHKTAEILLESQYIVTFPKFNLRDTTKFLESYMFFKPNELDEIKNIKNDTRALIIRKSVPNFILWEKGIKLI